MKTLLSRLLLIALLATAAAPAAPAQGLQFALDNNHTKVMFRVRHLGVSWVTGQFKQFEGSFVLDTANVGQSSATLTIQTASVDTEVERRDNHLRSNDFFAADSFPTITFTSTRVERGREPGTYVMHGNLTIRGTTRPITLDVEQTGMRSVANRQGGRSMLAGFLLSGRINRHDFGLRWNNLVEGVGVAGDEVRIMVEAEARAPIS